jgi:hypothetical protein
MEHNMKELVFAVISICLHSGECETHQVKIEPKVCQLKTAQAQVPVAGEWKDATVRFKC